MSTEREQGLEALQRNDVFTAIAMLERAVQIDATDYTAFMYLGAAYTRADRHQEAVQTLTQAVTLQPGDAQARFNLGVTLERAGYKEQAVTALQQALTLQPGYAKAQDALNRIQGVAPTMMPSPAPEPTQGYAPPAPGYAPPGQMPPQTLAGYAPQQTQPVQGYAAPQTLYGQPPMQPGGIPYSTPAPPVSYPQYPYYEDAFSIKQAFQDWWSVLKSPKQFFAGQVGREGYNGPLSMMLVHLGTFLLALFIGVSLMMYDVPAAIIGVVIAVCIYAVVGFVGALVGNFIMAGLFHLTGKIFGNRAGYGASFRAFVYSQSPLWAYLSLMMLFVPMMMRPVFVEGMKQGRTMSRTTTNRPFGGLSNSRSPRSPFDPSADSPFDSNDSAFTSTSTPQMPVGVMVLYGVYFLVLLWGVVVLGIGIAHVQQLSTGGAIGTVIIGYILPVIVIGMLLMMLFGAVIASLSSGGRGTGTFR